MFAKLRAAIFDDKGAVTIDWVVLTGASVALAIVMMSTLNGQVSDIATDIGHVLTDVEVATLYTDIHARQTLPGP